MGPSVREPVFGAPAEHNETGRMRRAHEAAALHFQTAASGPEVWGWQGRTRGRRADDCWLRVVLTDNRPRPLYGETDEETMSTAHQPVPCRPVRPAPDSAPPRPTGEGPGPAPSVSRVRTGGCLCGHTQYEVTGDPDDPHLCACRHETRISGAPTVLWVGFPRESLRWVGPGGEPTWYASWSTLHRGFCPRCGSQLVSVADDSDMVMVAFSLDDPAAVGFSFRDQAIPWMSIQLAAVSESAVATP